MRIAIIGAEGQLAHHLTEALAGEELFPITHRDVSVEDRGAIVAVAEKDRPEVIINTAAFNKVDLCEDERLRAFDVNCLGAMNGALAAERAGAKYVFFSTDYVFGADSGRRTPYAEDDPPGPVNVYGWSKVAGEVAAMNMCRRSFVIRSSGIYGVKTGGKGYNFPGMMLRLAGERDEVKVVNDQHVTPTNAKDLALVTAQIIRTERYGLYHATNTGECTWYEFARALFALTGMKTKLTAVTSAEFSAKARRPAYSVLDNRALRAAGLEEMRPWREALLSWIEEMGLS
jgi:dTDP-4-dehydrorhamnose reductase